jgi:hypothetical protein
VKFIRVKSYLRGVSEPPEEMVLNAEHIVAFFQRHFNDGTPYVYLDTTQQSGLRIAGTVDELMEAIKDTHISRHIAAAIIDAVGWMVGEGQAFEDEQAGKELLAYIAATYPDLVPDWMER